MVSNWSSIEMETPFNRHHLRFLSSRSLRPSSSPTSARHDLQTVSHDWNGFRAEPHRGGIQQASDSAQDSTPTSNSQAYTHSTFVRITLPSGCRSPIPSHGQNRRRPRTCMEQLRRLDFRSRLPLIAHFLPSRHERALSRYQKCCCSSRSLSQTSRAPFTQVDQLKPLQPDRNDPGIPRPYNLDCMFLPERIVGHSSMRMARHMLEPHKPQYLR